jgi:phosphatidate cytidylyltransferase
MLRWRVTLGALFIGLLVALFWLDHRLAPPGIALMPLALLLAVAATGELLQLLAARGFRPCAWAAYCGSVTLVALHWIPVVLSLDQYQRWALALPLSGWGLAVCLVFVAEMCRYQRSGEVVERLALALLAIAYVGGLLGFVVLLRLLSLPDKPPGSLGIVALGSLVIVVKLSDIGAYTVGRLIGRHKLAPVLSPRKTIEGALGGLVFACGGAYLSLHVLAPPLVGELPIRPWCWLMLGLLLAVFGMLGDLAESLIKRDVGRKDSSRWMPGFGGLLDLLDSVLLAAPAAYVFWNVALACRPS